MEFLEKNDRVCEGSYEIKIRAHTWTKRDYIFVYWYYVDAKTGNEAIRKLQDRILELTKKRDREALKKEMTFRDDIIDMLFEEDGELLIHWWEFIVLRYPDYYDYLEKDDK